MNLYYIMVLVFLGSISNGKDQCMQDRMNQSSQGKDLGSHGPENAKKKSIKMSRNDSRKL